MEFPTSPSLYWEYVDRKAVANHDCPYCGSVRGERCVTSSGNAASMPHADRTTPVVETIKTSRGENKSTYMQVRVSDGLLTRIDQWRARQPIEVTRSSVLRAAVEEYLIRHG